MKVSFSCLVPPSYALLLLLKPCPWGNYTNDCILKVHKTGRRSLHFYNYKVSYYKHFVLNSYIINLLFIILIK